MENSKLSNDPICPKCGNDILYFEFRDMKSKLNGEVTKWLCRALICPSCRAVLGSSVVIPTNVEETQKLLDSVQKYLAVLPAQGEEKKNKPS